ncbi:Long-chain-fatty-acid--CoA ligase [bacterium HR17]|uniref:Long-chain-fatty-acid--CoA ligase n=1 Tax=Candidatus Fervidibacter japonicus TaxID=2035412 RepID=A0A2H5XD78_9BACT|nr:Long-chain-fatty-acid--CoA ligase [bacterium HR17]
MGWVRAFYAGKTLLVTGATGFLGKALVEKVLRALPEVRKVYLLVRGKRLPDGSWLSAEERMKQEFYRSAIFTTLRRRYQDRFDAFLAEKVVVLEGDLAFERLGLDAATFDAVAAETDVIINSAAVVSFDERLDKALHLNALGVLRILESAKRGQALRVQQGKPAPIFAHISTCYVCGVRNGVVPETPPDPTGVDEEIAQLLQLCRNVEEQAVDDDAPPPIRERAVRESMVEEGMQRAKARGFNDTYTYTKWLGERLLVAHCGDIPTLILRPAIIESTLREPEPGWIENQRMADPLIIGFAKRQLIDFPGNPDCVVDLIPCDFVVNAVLAAIAALGQETKDRGRETSRLVPHATRLIVIQIATSTQNPLTLREVVKWCVEYFERHPLLDRDGRPMTVKPWTLPPLDKYCRRLERQKRFVEWQERLAQTLAFLPAARQWQRRLSVLKAALERLEYFLGIYAPYTHFKARFATDTMQRLWAHMDEDDRRAFFFDVTAIDWRHYLQDVHIPGLKRHILRIAEDEGAADTIQTLPDLLAHTAARFPNKVALQRKGRKAQGAERESEWVRYTYGELHRLAQTNAARLQALGVGHTDRVVLCGDNCPEWVIAYFSASYAGATVVPLDRQWRPDDLAAIAQFVEAKAALVSDNLADTVRRALRQVGLDIPVLPFSALTATVDLASPSISRPALPAPRPDDIASIIFVTGPSVEPRGAMLTHRNFLSDLRAIVKVLPPMHSDHFLSLLPLHHAFAFTGELLVALWAGATITYPENLRSRTVLETMREVGATALIGVPRVFQILHDSIHAEVRRRGRWAWLTFQSLKKFSLWVRRLTGQNLGRQLFAPVHRQFGNKLRALISGGAALPPHIFDDFTAMGFLLCEGYGLTEAAPVVTVNPMYRPKRGSVGKPLPGVEVVIANPDERGVGEILVRGPNVFVGYFRNPAATERMLRDGWLHTGDLGRFDRDGYLYITGRVKDVIVTAAGKNVYPEELERHFASIAGVKEVCVVGVWDEETMGERPHLVVVPEPQWASTPERLREFEQRLRQEVQRRSQSLPSYQRIAHIHIVPDELPKTVALAPDRAAVRTMVVGQGAQDRGQFQHIAAPKPNASKSFLALVDQLVTVIAHLTKQPKERIAETARMDELGIDSLLRVELTALLEMRFRVSLPESAIAEVQTVGELAELLAERLGGWVPESVTPENGAALFVSRLLQPETRKEAERWLRATKFQVWVRRLTQTLLTRIYERWFAFEACGLENLPASGPFIIAANHASHMDTGAVIVALGERAEGLFVLGARDYFFNTRLKGWLFHTFLRVVPFDRTVNPLEGLRIAAAILRAGYPLLIFPEGTRSVTGKLQPFKPGLGLLAVETGVPVVPALIEGTFEALPKGRWLPRKSRIRVTFGEPIKAEMLVADRTVLAEIPPSERRELYQRLTDEVRHRLSRMGGAL